MRIESSESWTSEWILLRNARCLSRSVSSRYYAAVEYRTANGAAVTVEASTKNRGVKADAHMEGRASLLVMVAVNPGSTNDRGVNADTRMGDSAICWSSSL